jgi:hypothetical protein
MSRTGRVTVFTLADERYAPGLVGLLNSLRLHGHDWPVVVLDGGMTLAQYAVLGDSVSFVRLPREVAERGYLAKSQLSTLEIDGVVLWIDSDVIVTQPLDELVGLAREGRICAFRDDWPAGFERRFAEWEALFGLAAPPRHQTYVSAGCFAFSTEHWPSLIRRWAEAIERVPPGAMFTGEHDENPLWGADQDALNALLMSEVPAEALAAYPTAEMVHTRVIDDAFVVDQRRLHVVHQGRTARLVHYSWGAKPWMAADWRRIGPNAYVRLLQRLLFADDVELRLAEADVPVWLRPSRTGGAALRAIVAARCTRGAAGGLVRRLPAPARRPLEALRDRVDGWIIR